MPRIEREDEITATTGKGKPIESFVDERNACIEIPRTGRANKKALATTTDN